MGSAILAARHRTFVLVVKSLFALFVFPMHNKFLLLLLLLLLIDGYRAKVGHSNGTGVDRTEGKSIIRDPLGPLPNGRSFDSPTKQEMARTPTREADANYSSILPELRFRRIFALTVLSTEQDIGFKR